MARPARLAGFSAGALKGAKSRLLQVETQSRFSLLFAHDLRANSIFAFVAMESRCQLFPIAR